MEGTQPITFGAEPASPPTHSTEEGHVLRHKIFVAYVAVMILIFLAPVPSTHLAESNHLDKLVHFGIFLVFALLFHVDRAPSVWWALLTAFTFAAAIPCPIMPCPIMPWPIMPCPNIPVLIMLCSVII